MRMRVEIAHKGRAPCVISSLGLGSQSCTRSSATACAVNRPIVDFRISDVSCYSYPVMQSCAVELSLCDT
jgi:hypothetical protein